MFAVLRGCGHEEGSAVDPAVAAVYLPEHTDIPPATPQLGRLHGHEIEGYIEEAKQRCPKGGGYPEAPSRRPEGGHHSQASSRGPEGGHHSKPSNGGQEGGLHSEAEVRSQDRQSRGEDRYGGCQERR